MKSRRIARIPSQRVFRQSTNASDGEVNVIGTQKANIKWPTNGKARIGKNGRLTRTVDPEAIALAKLEKRPSYLTPFTPTSERRRDEHGRFTKPLPPKPTHNIATGRPLS